jgi:hypothetical protein
VNTSDSKLKRKRKPGPAVASPWPASLVGLRQEFAPGFYAPITVDPTLRNSSFIVGGRSHPVDSQPCECVFVCVCVWGGGGGGVVC